MTLNQILKHPLKLVSQLRPVWLVAVFLVVPIIPLQPSAPTPFPAQYSQGLSEGKTLVENPEAPVLTEYFGFDCPACRKYHARSLPDVIKKLVRTGKIQYRLRHHPADPDGEQTFRAHHAAECAAEQNQFWQMMDVFRYYWPLSKSPDWEKYGELASVPDVDEFLACQNDNRYRAKIESERNHLEGGSDQQLPHFQLKGKHWSGNLSTQAQINQIQTILNKPESFTSPTAPENIYEVTNIELEPKSPSTMNPGDWVHFRVEYKASNRAKDGVNVKAQPYSDGDLTPGSAYYESSLNGPGQGVVEGHLVYAEETSVDELRIRMKKPNNEGDSYVKKIPLDYEWKLPDHKWKARGRPPLHDPSIDEAQFLAGNDLWRALEYSFKNADRSIRLYHTIFPMSSEKFEENPARDLSELLVERAEDGVVVEIMTSSYEHPLIRNQVTKAKEFFDSTPVRFQMVSTRDDITHEGEIITQNSPRTVIEGQAVMIDETELYLGNFVMSDNSFATPNTPGLKITGPGAQPVIEDLSAIFREHFPVDSPKWRRPDPAKLEEFELYLGREITSPIVNMINNAEDQIELGMYRFLRSKLHRSRAVLDALIDAHNRGVDVDILIKKSNSLGDTQAVQRLRKHDLPLRTYDNPEGKYQRYMVADDRVYLGSQAFDIELIGWGYGLSFIGTSPKLAGQIRSYHDYWQKQSKPLYPEATSLSGKSDRDLPEMPGKLVWSYETEDQIQAGPALSPDEETIYIGGLDSNLYALAPTGDVKWIFQTDGRIHKAAAVAPDGTIYFGNKAGKLYALKPDGSVKWSFQTNEKISATPAISSDGKIYIGSDDGNYYAFNNEGKLQWKFPTNGHARTVSIGPEGTLYGMNSDGHLYALTQTGNLQWKYNAGDFVRAPAIGPNGAIYFGSHNNNLYNLNPEGAKTWVFQAKGTYKFTGSPILGPTGKVYSGNASNKLYALSNKGSLQWTFRMESRARTPTIGNNGIIYAPGRDHKLYALNPDGTQKWEFSTEHLNDSPPVIDSDGVLYFGSHDHNIYAITTEASGLADSSWPSWQNTNQNVGRMVPDD